MVSRKTMTELRPGEKGVVSELYMDSAIRRRLQDMGLVGGTEIECVGKSPLGDPTAYLVRRTVIALRSEDSDKIKVEVGEYE